MVGIVYNLSAFSDSICTYCTHLSGFIFTKQTKGFFQESTFSINISQTYIYLADYINNKSINNNNSKPKYHYFLNKKCIACKCTISKCILSCQTVFG